MALASLLSSCATVHSPPTRHHSSHHIYKNKRYSHSEVLHRLYAQYHYWRGVRYKYGGYSRHGVDCSGFTKITFKKQFDIYLERTTEGQAKQGVPISKRHLIAGDLVFFNTGWSSHHVGIYLKHDKFLNASSSKGVTISNLKNVYWRKHYWKSRRIINV